MSLDKLWILVLCLGINVLLGRWLSLRPGERSSGTRFWPSPMAAGASLVALSAWPSLAAEPSALGVLALSVLLQLLGLSLLQLIWLARAGSFAGEAEEINQDQDRRCPRAPSA